MSDKTGSDPMTGTPGTPGTPVAPGLTGALARMGVVFQPEDGAGAGDTGAAGSAPAGGDGGGGGQPAAIPENWKETLPEELRNDPTVQRYGSVADMAKGLVHANGLIGRDKIPVPKDENETLSALRQLGAPESADEIKLQRPELPDNFPIDENLEGAFREKAAELGLLPQQAQALHEWFLSENANHFNALQSQVDEKRQEAEQALKQELGNAYDSKLNLARNAARNVGGEDFSAYLEQTGLGNDPNVIRFLVAVGEKMSEDGGDPGGGDRSSFALTPGEAQQKIAELQGDPNFMKQYQNRTAPGHGEAIQRMQQLFEAAYPGQTA